MRGNNHEMTECSRIPSRAIKKIIDQHKADAQSMKTLSKCQKTYDEYLKWVKKNDVKDDPSCKFTLYAFFLTKKKQWKCSTMQTYLSHIQSCAFSEFQHKFDEKLVLDLIQKKKRNNPSQMNQTDQMSQMTQLQYLQMQQMHLFQTNQFMNQMNSNREKDLQPQINVVVNISRSGLKREEIINLSHIVIV